MAREGGGNGRPQAYAAGPHGSGGIERQGIDPGATGGQPRRRDAQLFSSFDTRENCGAIGCRDDHADELLVHACTSYRQVAIRKRRGSDVPTAAEMSYLVRIAKSARAASISAGFASRSHAVRANTLAVAMALSWASADLATSVIAVEWPG